ncbi:MAG: hypothetical protein QOE63_1074 [Acidimicrobiaceae bacterium]
MYKSWPIWARITVPVFAGLVALGGVGAATGSGDQPAIVKAGPSTTVVAPRTTERHASTTQAPTTTTSTTTSTTTTVPPTTAPPTTAPPTTATFVAPPETEPPATQPPDVYYANCTAARNAGAAPIYRGQPGYRAALDRDNDGIACET